MVVRGLGRDRVRKGAMECRLLRREGRRGLDASG